MTRTAPWPGDGTASAIVRRLLIVLGSWMPVPVDAGASGAAATGLAMKKKPAPNVSMAASSAE